MPGSLKIGRVAGIDIAIHYTWLIAFALVTWSLAEGFFPSSYPGFSVATYWLIAAIAAVLLFACVLVHELSHSLVAVSLGLTVRSITLFVFGGISTLENEAPNARGEFLVAIVGPATSLVLAGIFWVLEWALVSGDSPQRALLDYLTFINLVLGAFNLVPGFPLDGGRVLRSIVWATTRSLRRATNTASMVGQLVGFLLIAWGVWRFLSGDFLGGMWTAFIGWFLNSSAESTRRQQVVGEDLRTIRVAQLMNPDPPLASAELSVRAFMLDEVLRRGYRAVLVTDGGQLRGVMTLSDAKEVSPDEWERTSIGEVMTRSGLKTVRPDTPLGDALKLMVDGSLHQLPVVDNGRVVGLLGRSEVLRAIQLGDELRVALDLDAHRTARRAA